jgi:type II secretory pathway pseudopilin PulG
LDVRVDGEADWMGNWIESPEAVVSFHIEDSFSGVNASTVEYRYTTRSRSDLELTAWTKAGVIVGEDGTVTLPAIEFGMGDRNHIQFRGRDLAGNAFSYSKSYNLWVNTLPVAVMSSPEDGIEVLDQTVIRFDGTLSRDYDGDALTYTWIDTVLGVESVIESGSDDPARFDLALAVGEHTIKLKVSDGIHTVETDPVTVIVKEIIVQEWLSPVEDKDGDGLSNLYEFIYHLGWNDDGNKDTAYEPGYWGKDRAQIKDLIGESVATTENDFDGDGYTDYKEWLYDTNPTDVNDFPKFASKGSPGPEAVDTLLIVLIVIAIVVIVAVIVVLALNSMAIRRKLSEEAAQAAQEEQVQVQRLLEGGGNQKLAALKAASEGKAVLSLPSPLTAQSALPMGEPVAAATMVQPVAAAPAGWVAAPAAEPGQSSQYANINSGTNVPPN